MGGFLNKFQKTSTPVLDQNKAELTLGRQVKKTLKLIRNTTDGENSTAEENEIQQLRQHQQEQKQNYFKGDTRDNELLAAEMLLVIWKTVIEDFENRIFKKVPKNKERKYKHIMRDRVYKWLHVLENESRDRDIALINKEIDLRKEYPHTKEEFANCIVDAHEKLSKEIRERALARVKLWPFAFEYRCDIPMAVALQIIMKLYKFVEVRF